MKNILTTLLIILSANVWAQNGFYLQPTIGAGITGSNIKINSPIFTDLEHDPTFSYNARVGVIYKLGRVQLITGIGYIRTGYKREGDFRLEAGPNTTFPQGIVTKYTWNTYYHQIAVPLQIGHEIRVSEKLSMVAAAGVEVLYNLGQTNKIKTDKIERGNSSSKEFYTHNRHFGLNGAAQLQFGYKLNKKMGIVAGPSFRYMVTSMYNNNFSGAFLHPSMRNYALFMDVGITMKL